MKSTLRARLALVVSVVLVGAGLAVAGSTAATASQPSDPGPAATKLPSAVPSAITPSVDDGKVYGIAQTGNFMVLGGSFTSVGGQTRNRFVAFNKNTGAVSSIAPSFNNDVNAVIPGPTPNTVIVGGNFTQVGSTAAKFLAEIDLDTGNVVSTFKPPTFDIGYVNDLVSRGSRLYVAGTFTKAGGKLHAGLASLNFTTGALDPFFNVQFTGHHNDSGSGAQGWIGPWDIDVTNDGSTMVVIGNFKYADGLLRDQAAMIDLSGSAAQVAPWATNRYSPLCFNWAFDSYVRGVSFSPDGSYFIVNATGGGVAGTLCDATTRFDTNPSDSNAQPAWVDETGGDTTWGVTVTDTVVYVGGHNRWNNNPLGSDHALPGAVPRPGLAAFDPQTGRPFKWNPGRRPLGTAVYAVLATADGLWIGSNTDWVGNRQYKRPKIAFFPYTGGYEAASTAVSGLPGTLFAAGTTSAAASNVLYRIDAAGPAIQSIDNGPDWAADTTDPSPYRNNGTNQASYATVQNLNASVPASTPRSIFDTERWSPSDSPAMNWTFPVASGTHVQVRLYFANQCTCTSGSGQRRFNVKIDNSTVLNQYDIVADTGDQTGTMKPFNITSDGTVNIDFAHVTENPLINGIELINTDVPTPPPGANDTLNTIAFDGTHATSSSANNQSIDFGNWRGAFLAGDTVFYGYTDSNLYSRSFNNGTFGPAVKIDPYNDPFWSDIDTDDGTVFRGAVPSLYGQMPNVTGMTYYQGRLYYTLFNDSHLYSRWFLPDSGIIDETKRTESSSVNFSDADGMFVTGGKLYYVTKSNGNIQSVAFSNGTVSGSPTTLSGPGLDGVDWRNRALFLSGTTPNQAPTASFTSNCTNLTCSFDATGSHDEDGTVASYDWDFGDGTTGTGLNPSHPYGVADDYTVSLTVTDNQNATSDPVTHVVSPTMPPPSGIAFVAAAHSAGGNTKLQQATVPASASAGDTALLFLTRPTPAAWTGPTGVTGFTQLDSFANSTLTTTVWSKQLTAGDVGATVKFNSAAYAHGSVELAVYSGADATTPVAGFTHASDAGATSSHTTPTASAATGNYVVSYWGDRAATPVTWSPPGTLTARDASPDTGSGVTVQGLIADSGAGASAGTVGGFTATTSADTARGSAWTVVLQAGSGPPPPPNGVSFVGANHSAGGNTKVQTVSVPGAAAAGDTALLFLTRPSAATWAGPTGVTGWTQLDSYTNSTLITTVWTKTLSSGDGGSNVRFDSTKYSHGSAEIAVYAGVASASTYAHSNDGVASSSHTTPTATAAAGDWVVSFWADRTSSVRTWTAPGDVLARDASPDSGAGVTVQGLVGDSNGAVSAGSYGNKTATTDANTDRASEWTIVLTAA